MDNFNLQAYVANGQIEMYVGLDPASLPNTFIWKAVSVGGVASIAVKTTDVNFHIGAMYYNYIKSVAA